MKHDHPDYIQPENFQTRHKDHFFAMNRSLSLGFSVGALRYLLANKRCKTETTRFLVENRSIKPQSHLIGKTE